MPDDPSAEFDAAAERIYAVAGRCINGWAFVDQALFDIFQAVLGTDLVKASIVYYRASSFNDHLVLTDRIVSATLSKGTPERTDWGALKKRVEAMLPIRNKIAHHPLTVFNSSIITPNAEEAGLARVHERWLAYVEESRKLMHLNERERFGRITETQIREVDLVMHHNATVELHTDLRSFLDRAADALAMSAPTDSGGQP